MSRAARTISQSGVYHIVFRGVNQQNLFEEKADFEKLKDTVKNVKEEMKFEIYAYCFMSNHVHIVLKEMHAGEISLIMKRILTKYARWYNIKYGRSGALIANRYKSAPVEIDEYYLQLIRYVHQNPLKAGVVKFLEEYKYSSYGDYINDGNFTDTKMLFEMIDKEAFIEFHKEISDISFKVSDSKRKTDEDVLRNLKKNHNINNPKLISKLNKEERDKILGELKRIFPIRQLQRITGVSRGVISRVK